MSKYQIDLLDEIIVDNFAGGGGGCMTYKQITDAEGQMWLEDRIMKIQSVIGEYGEDQFYLSFSGGKDSTALHHLLDEALPGNRIPRVYCNTGIEYVEMVRFVKQLREQDDRIEIITPGINIQRMLREKGYPFKSKEHSSFVDTLQSRRRKGLPPTRFLEEYFGRKEKQTRTGKIRGDLMCPKILQYQYEEDFKIPISDHCCEEMKESPLDRYARENGKSWTIIGIMADEGGRRKKAKCLAFKAGRTNAFQPLAVMTKEWENWYIKSRNIQLCKLYYPPYNFERTGCKGCPFNIHLRQDLDILQQFFPAERRQCELIWKPVYDEYRRLGYRLRKDDGQLSLFDY